MVYSSSFNTAERCLGLSAAFIAPADRIAVRGLGLAYQNITGDTSVDLTSAEMDYRREVCIEKSVDETVSSATQLGVELQRQMRMRCNAYLPIAVADTVRYRADGASGFVANRSPYAFVGRMMR